MISFLFLFCFVYIYIYIFTRFNDDWSKDLTMIGKWKIWKLFLEGYTDKCLERKMRISFIDMFQ